MSVAFTPLLTSSRSIGVQPRSGLRMFSRRSPCLLCRDMGGGCQNGGDPHSQLGRTPGPGQLRDTFTFRSCPCLCGAVNRRDWECRNIPKGTSVMVKVFLMAIRIPSRTSALVLRVGGPGILPCCKEDQEAAVCLPSTFQADNSPPPFPAPSPKLTWACASAQGR